MAEPAAVRVELDDRVVRILWRDIPQIAQAHLRVLVAKSRLDGRATGEKNGEGRGVVEFAPREAGGSDERS